MRSSVGIVIVILFVSTWAFAGSTYYVAKSGDDLNPCSEARPCRTINRGISKLAGGDTLIVRGGTYKETLDCRTFPDKNVCIPPGTSWDNPTVVKAFTGDVVKIKPKNKRNPFRVIGFADRLSQYIVLEGLTIDATRVSGEAIKITNGANHIRIRSCEVKSSSISHGILITDGNGVSDHNEILDCEIHDNGNNWTGPASPPHNIYIQTGHNLVHGCDIYNSPNGVSVLHFDGGTANTFRNNSIHHSKDGIIVGGDDDIAYNNVLYANDGIDIKIGSGSGVVNNIRVYNNTCYNSGAAIYVGVDVPGITITNALVRNNILYQRDGAVESIHINSDAVGTVFENNLLRNAAVIDATSTRQASNSVGAPLFSDAAADNYHLKDGSPAKNLGQLLPEVPSDKDGVTRPQDGAYDIGAYEIPSRKSTVSTLDKHWNVQPWLIAILGVLVMLGVILFRFAFPRVTRSALRVC